MSGIREVRLPEVFWPVLDALQPRPPSPEFLPSTICQHLLIGMSPEGARTARDVRFEILQRFGRAPMVRFARGGLLYRYQDWRAIGTAEGSVDI